MSTTGIVVLLFAFTIGVLLVLLYNHLVTLKNRFLNGFSQIDVQLQRRYELIPNLVETAKAYMDHESETLTVVTEARNAAYQSCSAAKNDREDASLINALASADGALNQAMGRFNMVMENYPDFKADEQMFSLMEELTSTENRVSFARQAYSDAVMSYNTAIEKFPVVFVARLFAFKEAGLFEVEDKIVRKAVNVSFA